MTQIVWDLTEQGRALRVFRIDPLTRRATLLIELLRSSPMTEAEAQRYMDANYPNNGAVRAAAEILGNFSER